MKNISAYKLVGHYWRVKAEHTPITADVFLTNYCNNKCPYCTYRRWELDNDAKYMSFDEFRTYATRMLQLGVKGIILTGGGEPTLDKDFNQITNWLEENYIHYGINTNFNSLKLFKPDYLKVSLDGWDEESYRRSRGVEAYEKTKRNIIEYAKWKSEHSENTSLGVQMVATSEDDVYRFYEANANLPVDYFSIRPMESTNGSFYSNEKELEKSALITSAIKKISEKDSRVSCSFKWDMLRAQEPYCIANWSQIAINERGDVMYCCHKPYQIVGNIMDKDILEKKANASTDMKTCDIPCRLTAPNMIASLINNGQKDEYFI